MTLLHSHTSSVTEVLRNHEVVYIPEIIIITIALIGLGLISKGFTQHRQYTRIRDTATSTIRSVSLGKTEITGTASPIDTTFTAPVTGNDALLIDYTIEKREGRNLLWDEWYEITSGTDTTPFTITDKTGELTVNPEEATVDISTDNTAQLEEDYNETDTPALTTFKERHNHFESDVPWPESPVEEDDLTRYRYTERIIRPSDTVYLYGTATSPDNTSDILIQNTDTGIFLISDQSPQTLKNKRKYALIYRVTTGSLALTFAILMALFEYGYI